MSVSFAPSQADPVCYCLLTLLDRQPVSRLVPNVSSNGVVPIDESTVQSLNMDCNLYVEAMHLDISQAAIQIWSKFFPSAFLQGPLDAAMYTIGLTTVLSEY